MPFAADFGLPQVTPVTWKGQLSPGTERLVLGSFLLLEREWEAELPGTTGSAVPPAKDAESELMTSRRRHPRYATGEPATLRSSFHLT